MTVFTKKTYCKKLVFKNYNSEHSNSILLGVVINTDQDFIYFRTGNTTHAIPKINLISISDTDQEFRILNLEQKGDLNGQTG